MAALPPQTSQVTRRTKHLGISQDTGQSTRHSLPALVPGKHQQQPKGAVDKNTVIRVPQSKRKAATDAREGETPGVETKLLGDPKGVFPDVEVEADPHLPPASLVKPGRSARTAAILLLGEESRAHACVTLIPPSGNSPSVGWAFFSRSVSTPE